MGAPDQRLALHVLNSLNHFVPEHVETRRLYNHIQPNIEQVRYCKRMLCDIVLEF
jgi:hypothetical protein